MNAYTRVPRSTYNYVYLCFTCRSLANESCLVQCVCLRSVCRRCTRFDRLPIAWRRERERHENASKIPVCSFLRIVGKVRESIRSNRIESNRIESAVCSLARNRSQSRVAINRHASRGHLNSVNVPFVSYAGRSITHRPTRISFFAKQIAAPARAAPRRARARA